MPHNAFWGTDPHYLGFLRSEEWSLCLGAGICKGILPDWPDLTLEVLNRCSTATLTKTEFEVLNKTAWSLDAWLQVAMNMLIESKCQEPFSKYYDLLEESLYGKLLIKAEAANQKFALIAALNDPRKIKRKEVAGLLEFLDSNYGSSSLMALAKWLDRLAECPRAPRSILTFNADGLLDTLLRLLEIHQCIVDKKLDMPPNRFYRSLRASEPPPPQDSLARRIPIHHIHGCLTPQSPTLASRPGRESRESLVFPETTYGRISGQVFTWQQTMFLSHAQSHRIVFVGLSMSDSNIRRWLAWCNENALEEQELRKNQFAKSTGKHGGSNDYFIGQNIWITEHPKADNLAKAMEFSLAHLGTRICWINDWHDLPRVLKNLLPIK